MNFKHKYSLLCFLFLSLFSSCSEKPNSSQNSTQKSLRIAIAEDPFSLDPRLVRDLPSYTPLHMLYEGLMRTDLSGKLSFGAAKSVSVSGDKKTYTFTLRKSLWSDGTQVTAKDFEETWKSMLSPNFAAPNAYQLYFIKGAKEAKEGLQPVSDVGVTATSPDTLVVELNQPVPYFLEMTTCHFFFPVSQIQRNKASENTVIGNGPFRLTSWNKRNAIHLEKNNQYWDFDEVRLDKLEMVVLDENTALQLFKSKELDWAGSPLSTLPQDAISNLKLNGSLSISQGAGTHFVRANVERFPFDNPKMRRAFALAIDRKSIVEHVLQGNQQPATGLVPSSLQFGDRAYFKDNDLVMAEKLFNEALQDTNTAKNDLPKITLRYAANDRNHKIAQSVQQQWNKAFGISVALEASELQSFLDKMRTKDFFLSLGSWYADIEDPINFLEVFKSKDNPTNQTGWQDAEYIKLLEASSLEMKAPERIRLLKKGEKKLIEDMPVMPIFYSAYNYLKHPDVKNVVFSPLGYLDFKYATITDE